MAKFSRPTIPYNSPEASGLPNSNRYELITGIKKPISYEDLDGEFNYLIVSLNDFYEEFEQAAFDAILPGADDPENAQKFPTTNGASVISWTKILEEFFDDQCIPTRALQPGSIDSKILAEGSVSNTKIQDQAIKNNNIKNGDISFNKITIEDNVSFQNFFNAQADATLDGKKIQNNSIPGTAIPDDKLSGEKITTNTMPGTKIVDNSITSGKLSPLVRMPIGMVVPWSGPGNLAAPSGFVKANGQLLNPVTYPDLFNLYGNFFGGDGIATFGVPDLRGVSIFGIDPASPNKTNNKITTGTIAVGGTGGSEKHTLVIGEIPSHTHTYNKSITGNLIGSGSADRTYPAGPDIDSGSTGGDGAHNNMPPYMLMQFIIYAGV